MTHVLRRPWNFIAAALMAVIASGCASYSPNKHIPPIWQGKVFGTGGTCLTSGASDQSYSGFAEPAPRC